MALLTLPQTCSVYQPNLPRANRLSVQHGIYCESPTNIASPCISTIAVAPVVKKPGLPRYPGTYVPTAALCGISFGFKRTPLAPIEAAIFFSSSTAFSLLVSLNGEDLTVALISATDSNLSGGLKKSLTSSAAMGGLVFPVMTEPVDVQPNSTVAITIRTNFFMRASSLGLDKKSLMFVENILKWDIPKQDLTFFGCSEMTSAERHCAMSCAKHAYEQALDS